MYRVSLTTITAPLKSARTHEVQPGETARSISYHYYGNPMNALRILMLNGGVVTAGQTIRLP
jgi:hypothetical protein